MKEDVIIRVDNLKKTWSPNPLENIFSRKQQVTRAVDGISFDIKKGEIFCLVGESGCGKTTTARLVARLLEPTDGKVYFEELDVLSLNKKQLKRLRREIQVVFQDPYESLSDRMRVYDILQEPLKLHHVGGCRRGKIMESLETAGLTPPEDFISKYPRELSGGQRQRVCIARAIILQPKVIVADEPTSMIDVSVRCGIMNLMLDLRDDHGITFLLITHDFSVVQYMCDRIAVMYLGKIVELGGAEEMIGRPLHPYTQALMSAVPTLEPRVDSHETMLASTVPGSLKLPSGCRFHPRCKYARELCQTTEPEFSEAGKDHYAACHFIEEISKGS